MNHHVIKENSPGFSLAAILALVFLATLALGLVLILKKNIRPTLELHRSTIQWRAKKQVIIIKLFICLFKNIIFLIIS